VNQQKRARANYRHTLKKLGQVRQSRFDELMSTLIGAGSKACVVCRLVRPNNNLDEDGRCPYCATRLKAVGKATALQARSTRPLEPNIVYVDASFRDGIAGLAVVGEIGEYSKACPAPTSTAAEVMAFRWALELAEEGGYRDLIFRTDCTHVYDLHHRNEYRLGWVVEQVPRRENQHADRLAGWARTGNESTAKQEKRG
jgi:ribonuclease HI